MTDWHDAEDHHGSDRMPTYYEWAETEDPRVLVVIERHNEWGGGHIDGDIYAPTFYWDRYWGKVDAEAGSTYMDDEARRILELMIDARTRFQHKRIHSDVWERWARIYLGTTFEQVSSSMDQNTQVVILNTPGWREHIGYSGDAPLAPEMLSGDVHDWTAALDGDVYMIGYAINEARRLFDDEDVDLVDGSWDIQITCGGMLGEQYAKEAALEFPDGDPDLPEMLPIEVPA